MAVKGVDISEHNGSVNFQALKNAGIEFVLIRCGYGGDYSSQDDECFADNVRKADTAGLPWGVYLYSYAKNTDMAKNEVKHTLRLLNGRKPLYGVWYDLEDPSQANCDLVRIADTYCKLMEKYGLYCGIYSSLSWFESTLSSSKLDRYDKWVAQYYHKCEYEKPYGIWQFTDNLIINGEPFDCNWSYKDYPKIISDKEGFADMNKSRVFSEQGNFITNPFGNGHGGVDLGWDDNPNTPIIAHSQGNIVFCQTGRVNDTSATGNASYGNCVKIKHPNGYYTLYAHMNYVSVKNGQEVKKGQYIGDMGNTGVSYGNHLHFEVRNASDTRIDPAPYIANDLPGLPTKDETEEKDLTEVEVRKVVQDELNKFFSDLSRKEVSDWAKDAVEEVKDLGIMNGDSNGNFRPRSYITREETAILTTRLLDVVNKQEA